MPIQPGMGLSMTVLGVIFAAIGLLALAFSSKWLYRLTIFSIPFSATTVMNFGSGDTSSGIQVWMYFGLLWLIRESGLTLMFPWRSMPRIAIGRVSCVLLFVFVLLLSLLMPLYIDGALQIASPLLLDSTSTSLTFSTRNVTAILYVLFGALWMISMVRKNDSAAALSETERYYLGSGLLTASLGVVEFLAHLAGLTSPTVFLRNNAHLAVGAALGVLEDSFARTTSVAMEPSILSQFLLTVLPLTIPALFGKGHVFSKSLDRIAFFLIIFVLLVSTSSTAYLMLVVAPILCLPALTRLGLRTARILWLSCSFLVFIFVTAAVLYLFTPFGSQILNDTLLSKASGYSALERSMTIRNAIAYFREYPILGVGWGSITSHDLLALILGSSGILGLSAFIFMVGKVGRPLFKGMRGEAGDAGITQSNIIWFMSGVMLLAASTVSEFPYVFGHMWLVLAMCIASGLAAERKVIATILPNVDSNWV
jgi:hypothetical protein